LQSVRSFVECFPMSSARSRQANLLPMLSALSNKKLFGAYVIDFKLPDGSGLDVAERIRSKWGATPIILISGYAPAAVALRAEKLSISDFLEKPFSREVICKAIKKAIGSPKAAPKLSPVDRPASPAASGGRSWTRFWRRPAKARVRRR